YRRILEEMARESTQNVWELSLLSGVERQQLLVESNQTAAEYPRHKCLNHLFEEQVEKTPRAVALMHGSQQLSYEELNSRANQFGYYLKKLGIGPEVRVAIALTRSTEMFVAVLGVLKAGGAYVPLDSSHPADRLEYILKDAAVPVLITKR